MGWDAGLVRDWLWIGSQAAGNDLPNIDAARIGAVCNDAARIGAVCNLTATSDDVGGVRLLELDAEFVGNATTQSFRRQGDAIEGAQGVIFQCPKCAEGKEHGEEHGRRFVVGAHYVLCWFRNPQGAAPIPAAWYPKIARWEMFGSGLADLSLRPSVLLTGPGCGWHGWITAGEAA